MNPTFYITTLGCPKNVADSREMQKSLLREGFTEAEDAGLADFHVINSCAFIESAREETIRTVFEAADIKKIHNDQKLILAGCFAQRYESAVAAEMPEVDLSFGTGLYHRAGSLIRDRFKVYTSSGDSTESAFSSISRSAGEPYAPVKLSEGCDRICAFCAIPQFRGAFRPRDPSAILAEVQSLAEEGVREICLVSQDTNRFGPTAEKFFDLIESVAQVPGIEWIRPLYLYPDQNTMRILQQWEKRSVPQLVPYLESPVQHASDSVLKAMKRSGSYSYFQDLFAYARSIRPGMEIRTSLLLGFPGETAQDIDKVLRFIEEVRPEKLALFAYSPEEGTAGAALKSDLSQEEIHDRVNLVREAHLEVVRQSHLTRIGKVYRCMVDIVNPDGLILRRPQDAPEVDEIVHAGFESTSGPDSYSVGQLIDTEITGAFEYDMAGRIKGGLIK